MTFHIKFELEAQQQNQVRIKCFRNFFATNQLAIVRATVTGGKDGQHVNMLIRDDIGNFYGHPRDLNDKSTTGFTAHNDVMVEVCYENVLDPGKTQGLREALTLI
jgi:hypothetical protein